VSAWLSKNAADSLAGLKIVVLLAGLRPGQQVVSDAFEKI
jgi:hypothetical protein